MIASHIVNISGGKDSAAVALIAAERGRPFDLWMADTGNEAPVTVEYAHRLADFLGRPLNTARASFDAEIARKRAFVAENWPAMGVPAESVERALAVLQPTGNPFLDLCIWKGRFPSRKAQFCTEFLKQRAIEDAAVGPALDRGPVVQWLGVRRDESLNRRNAPMFQRVRRADKPHDMLLFRPIIHWTAANVFSFAAARGLDPNPLYLQGMARVGCFPCINASKDELREIARRFPEAFDKLAEWEALVKEASKRGAATFFAPDVTAEGARMGRRIKAEAVRWMRHNRRDLEPGTPAYEAALKARISEVGAAAPWPRAHDVAAWSMTDRGGRQFNMLDIAFEDEGLSCSSQYGLCE